MQDPQDAIIKEIGKNSNLTIVESIFKPGKNIHFHLELIEVPLRVFDLRVFDIILMSNNDIN